MNATEGICRLALFVIEDFGCNFDGCHFGCEILNVVAETEVPVLFRVYVDADTCFSFVRFGGVCVDNCVGCGVYSV